MNDFLGKYRGKVVNNEDPERRGRLRVQLPNVMGLEELKWALPCVPFAGAQMGFYAIPPVGANVWVEFEGGDIDHPIWSGCFWNRGEAPQPGRADTRVLQTEHATIRIVDTQGAASLSIELALDTKIKLQLKFDNAGIEISSGRNSIKLTQDHVTINDGAIEVT